MLGKAAVMSVEIENNPDVVSKEETFVKCTSKKKSAQKNKEDDGAKFRSGSVSDTELVTDISKAEKNTKHLSDDASHVKPSPSKSVGFLSDANANGLNRRLEEMTGSGDLPFKQGDTIHAMLYVSPLLAR